MKEIALLPENLLRMPSVVAVNDWYVRSFEEIIEFEKTDISPRTMKLFCDTLVRIRNRHSNVVETMAQGVLELKDSHDVDHHTEHSIQYFLDRFYMSRISIRMLINQHSKYFFVMWVRMLSLMVVFCFSFIVWWAVRKCTRSESEQIYRLYRSPVWYS